jgi:hypothetical protein
MGLLFGASNRLVNLAEPANGILASATFMDSNGQGFRIQVRQKISFGFEDLPEECVRRRNAPSDRGARKPNWSRRDKQSF